MPQASLGHPWWLCSYSPRLSWACHRAARAASKYSSSGTTPNPLVQAPCSIVM